MKRLISILVVLSSVLLNLVFAEVAFAKCGEDGQPACDSSQPATVDTSPSPSQDPSNKFGTETSSLFCNDNTMTYDPQKHDCVKGDDYCSGFGGDLKWDPSLHTCVDKNSSQGTVLPGTTLSETECEVMFNADAQQIDLLKNFLSGKDAGCSDGNLCIPNSNLKVSKVSVLGCAIKTGRIRLWMIPYFIKYFIQFALVVAGLVAVGAMVFGGYLYLFGALIDDKEKGKRAIIYGIGGFVVALLSWAIVNIVMALATR